MSNVKIRDIKVIVTAPRQEKPNSINLVVVKVETTEAGLCGYGCATFTWRYKPIVTAIEQYLRPMLIGRDVANIEDIWQTMMGSSYWRNGPVLNNAISGVDEALWDIKGKMANMPLYDLFGGKAREGIALYRHADGRSPEEVEENVRKYMEEGYRYVRIQQGTYGGNFDGKSQVMVMPDNHPDGAYYSPRLYMQTTVKLFDHIRNKIGFGVELLHDIHERLQLVDTLAFAKELEQFKLFFLEDAVAPEHGQYMRYLREQTSVPLALGEIFTNPTEWLPLVSNQWIDFIRCHISDIGGITPARKVTALCEPFGVRTAFHGPNDLSAVGAVAQMHIDISVHNFGIQEYADFDEAEREVFIGLPEIRNGYAYLNNKPGIGIEVNEEAAKKYPPTEDVDDAWMYSRLPDGTAVRP